MRALVTGVGGFVGSHLAEFLLEQGVEVVGVDKPGRVEGVRELVPGLTAAREVDLMHPSQVQELISELQPQRVFHLAAQASVSRSWEDPVETLTNNIVGQVHLFQAIIAAGICPRILVIGSNEEYGFLRPDELPVDEEHPLRPISPYAVSKVAQDLLGYQYFVSHGLHCVRMRPFNHIGPRQSQAFVASSLAKQVAEAEAGLREAVIRVGNLEVKRDFTDVRDVVRGYWLALEKGEAGEVYNIGSGRAVSVKSILDFFLAHAQISLRVEQDSGLFRPSDIPISYANCNKLRNQTGWEPAIPLEETLKDVLEYWRVRVAVEHGAS